MGGKGNKKSEEGKRIEQGKGLSICFWNVAGINKKYNKRVREIFRKM